ncbi:OmpA family protein [Rufibacter latericius]|uniref:OmpA family protein n=1 Tax=Rufibacter latericius TaxID=2487040 RepID=A0A3M9MBC3_9BACT|nr:OmpA family protein [Rufibacter latericius]RNI21868.1 OmpA family protein [Rufibacter latericius]
MADLDVQPKSSRPWWLWLLIGLVALALLFFLLRGCDNTRDEVNSATNETTSAVSEAGDEVAGAAATGAAAVSDAWDNVNLDAPAVAYDEITDEDIEVRGNEDYAVYSVDETVLFGSDKAAIQVQASQKLQQIAGSMGKRFNGGQVRIYGYTDAQGSASYNKELAEERTKAVQNWLVENGNISKESISLHPVGEANPVASNATAEGRQQNRRVQIVARRSE